MWNRMIAQTRDQTSNLVLAVRVLERCTSLERGRLTYVLVSQAASAADSWSKNVQGLRRAHCRPGHLPGTI